MDTLTENITDNKVSNDVLEVLNRSANPLQTAAAEEKADEGKKPDGTTTEEKPDETTDEGEKESGTTEEKADEGKKDDAVEEGKEPVVKPEIKEDDVVAFLKSKGIEASNIDELKAQLPKLEQQQDPAQLAVKKLKVKEFALTNKIVTPEVLDKFESDTKLPATEIAFRLYHESRKNETNEDTDEVFTEEELRAEFEKENHLGEEDTNPLKKRSLQKIDLIAQSFLYENYKELNKLDSMYESAQNEIYFNSSVTDIKSQMAQDGLNYSIPTDIAGETLSVKLPISAKDLKEIQLSIGELQDFKNTDEIREAIKGKLLIKNHDKIVHEVATAYHSQKIKDKIAGSKGIELKKEELAAVVEGNVSPEVQAQLDKANLTRKQNN